MIVLQNRHVVPRLIYIDSLHFHPQVITFQCVNKYESQILTPLYRHIGLYRDQAMICNYLIFAKYWSLIS
jgi:hypothetical protein